MDPLSDVLALLDIRAASPSRFEAAGQWALRFEGHEHIKIGAVLSGALWVRSDGGEPIHLRAGDCYLLTSGRPYVSASDLELDPADGHAVFAGIWPDTVYHNTTPDDPHRTVLVGGAVTFDDTASALLMECLPGTVRIDAHSHRAEVLHPTLRMLGEETTDNSPGSAAMREQLTLILFVQALRTLLAEEKELGWLGALNDKNIGAALSAIHRQPGHRWTVAELAAEAGMSRSTFALRFRAMVGLPPLDYLARWRMQNAVRTLRSTGRTVYSVATELGYASESAFSTAFKRVTGHPPSHYRPKETVSPGQS